MRMKTLTEFRISLDPLVGDGERDWAVGGDNIIFPSKKLFFSLRKHQWVRWCCLIGNEIWASFQSDKDASSKSCGLWCEHCWENTFNWVSMEEKFEEGIWCVPPSLMYTKDLVLENEDFTYFPSPWGELCSTFPW